MCTIHCHKQEHTESNPRMRLPARTQGYPRELYRVILRALLSDEGKDMHPKEISSRYGVSMEFAYRIKKTAATAQADNSLVKAWDEIEAVEEKYQRTQLKRWEKMTKAKKVNTNVKKTLTKEHVEHVHTDNPEYIKIEHNRDAYYISGDIRLAPGVNKLNRASMLEFLNNPIVKQDIALGLLKIVDDTRYGASLDLPLDIES